MTGRIEIAAADLFTAIRAHHATEPDELAVLIRVMALAHGLDDDERDAATKLAGMALDALADATEAMLCPVQAATLALTDPPTATRH